MRLAIMQPYFLPYIGYFQLIKAVDTFVIYYDDVCFIKQGWINRNRILIGGKAQSMGLLADPAVPRFLVSWVPVLPPAPHDPCRRDGAFR